MDFIVKYGTKYFLKQGLGFVFLAACALAKVAPIFDDGDYKADAVLYLLIGGLGYHLWRYWD